MERQIIACITIPGLNDWVNDVTNKKKETEAQLYVYLFTVIIIDFNILIFLI